MKTIAQKITGYASILILLLSAVVFILPNQVRAAEIFNQESQPDQLEIGSGRIDFQGTLLTGETGKLSRITISLFTAEEDCEEPTVGWQLAVNAVNLSGYHSDNALPLTNDMTFTFDETFDIANIDYVTVIPNGVHGDCTGSPPGYDTLVFYNGDSTNPQADYGQNEDNTFDPYMIIEDNLSKIEFVSPDDNQIGTDFEKWVVSATPDQEGLMRVQVNYGVGNTTDFQDLSGYWYFTTLPTSFLLAWEIPKSEDLSPDTYTAEACLIDENDTEIECTPEIEFEIKAGAKTENFITTGNIISPFTAARNSCSDTFFAIPEVNLFGFDSIPRIDFGKGLCKVATYLFVPTDTSMTYFNRVRTTFESKLPFSYFYDIQDAITTSLENEEGTVPTLTINLEDTDLPLGGSEGIELFSSDTVQEFAGETNVELFRDLMTWALWLIFMFAAYRIIKNVFSPHHDN